MINIRTLLIFTFILFVQSKHTLGQEIRYNEVKSIDTIEINVNVLETIDYPFEIIIENNLKKFKRSNCFLLIKNHLLIIEIEDQIGWYLPEAEREKKHEKFVSKDYGTQSGYNILCRMIKKNSVLLDRENLFLGKLFYYKYKNLDVIFTSELGINFPDIKGTKKFELIYESITYEPVKNGGKYSSYESFYRVWKRQPKKYENLITGYLLLNHAIYIVEYTTLLDSLNNSK